MRRAVSSNRLAYSLLCIFLASLSIKVLQEIGGIRILSTCIPLLLLILVPNVRLRIPISVKLYSIFLCVLLPIISIATKRGFSIYEIYIVITIFSSISILIVCVEALRLSLMQVMQTYADAMVFMCIAAVFTIQKQWFGGYTITGFSDFSTFFALQISVGVPFLSGRFKNVKRAICLVTLFFTFSRLSLVLSFAVVLVQLFQENRRAFYKLTPILIGGLLLAGTSTSVGIVMADKFANVFSAALGGTDSENINASDLGRLAYASVTIESLDNFGTLSTGHGIKTNRDIISSRLDVATWGLDEDLADATVHNVYLELLSDCGILGLVGFVSFLAFSGKRIISRYGALSAPGLSLLVFSISYLFEANYVSFFFQFLICCFLWMASDIRQTPAFTSRHGSNFGRNIYKNHEQSYA